MAKYCDMPTCDLRYLSDPEAIRQIEEIRDVAQLIFPADAAPEVMAAFAAVPGGKWMEEAFRVQDGAVLARLASVQAPSEEEWKMAEGEVNAQMMNDRMGMLYQTYIEQLAAKAEIKTFNSPLLGKLFQK